MELKIDPLYKEILSKLTEEEYEALKMSIKEHGQILAIIINQEDTIIDGHHRYKICKELGIEPKIEKREFASREEEAGFIFAMNIARRQPNKFKRAEIGYRLKMEEEKAEAKKRMIEGAKGSPLVGEPGKATGKIAKQIGIGKSTFEYALKVIKEAPEEIKELCRKEALGIRPAYGLVKAFKDVPEEPRKTLTKQLVEGEMEPKEIIRTIASTKAVKAQLAGEEDLVKQTAEALFKDQFYTKELDSKKAIWQIEEIAGDPHNLITKEFPLDKFSTFEDAQAWAVERDGVCQGKLEKWLIKYDPVKAKKIEESEKDESANKSMD